jgi:hypothetical protein
MKRDKEMRNMFPQNMQITVDKGDLLGALMENRRKHRTVFEAALEGYQGRLQEILEDKIKMIAQGKLPDIRITLIQPEDHTTDYDRIIKMAQMHQGETFDLDEQQFAQYVMDDWGWKRQWLETNTAYAAGSVKANYGG